MTNTSNQTDRGWDARKGTCQKCRGSGLYRWGTCVNGRMTHEGMCFECEGKGWVSRRDEARTSAYWNHRMVHELGA